MNKMTLVWTGDRKGNADFSTEVANTKVAIPLEFNGSGEGFGPKELLAGASASCILTTLLSILESRNLSVERKEMESTVKKDGDVWTITHTLKIGVPKSIDDETLAAIEQAIISAERSCEVGQILVQGGMKINFQRQIFKL